MAAPDPDYGMRMVTALCPWETACAEDRLVPTFPIIPALHTETQPAARVRDFVCESIQLGHAEFAATNSIRFEAANGKAGSPLPRMTSGLCPLIRNGEAANDLDSEN